MTKNGPAEAYYTSGDLDAPTWGIYRETYAERDDEEPVDGSQERIATAENEVIAYAIVNALYNALPLDKRRA